MRSLLAAVAVIIAAALPAHADEPIELDWMAVLLIAGEKCPGHNYRGDALAKIFNESAKRLGWSEAKLESEARDRALAQLREYNEDPQVFCVVANSGRKQLMEELKAAGAM